MDRLSGMKLFICYVKDRLKLIIAFISFIFVFAAVYRLYNLDMFPICYSIFVVCVIVVIYGVFDFVSYVKKYKQLYIIHNNIKNSLLEFPKSSGLLESSYQTVISELAEERVNLISKTDIKQKDMMDYYTMWVHQIKTPISAMRILLQENEKFDIRFEQELFKIEQYVEMVLHYLRLESMSSDLILKEYSIYNLVKQAVKKFSVVFINKKNSLKLEEFELKAITDEKWIVFVIEQIISNALKYTDKGTISIYTENNTVLVIEDTGIGICPEDLPRIFEKGFTGYNGRMDKKSTGIGLYLCKKILDRLCLDIKVTSELGKGSKVSVDFKTELAEYF